MPDLILKMILPCLGILIILFCIGAYFFKYGANLKDKLQEFKLFGADVKISLITVFIIIGLIFVFAGTYFNVADTNSKLTKMMEDEKGAKSKYELQILELEAQLKALKLSQNKTLDYFLDLNTASNFPNPAQLRVTYKVWGSENREIPLKCTSVTLFGEDRLQITISDLSTNTFITAMEVLDITTNQKWEVKSFYPLSPSLKLEPSM